MEINLAHKSILTRLFDLAELEKEHFYPGGYPEYWYPKSSTNFCYLIRSIFVHLLFIYGFRLLTVFALYMALVHVPTKLLGPTWYWIPGIVVLMVVFGFSLDYLSTRVDLRKQKRIAEDAAGNVVDTVIHIDSIFQTFGKYLIAQKQRICPAVTIHRTGEDTEG